MIAVDTNILVYAHRPEMPFSRESAAVLQGLASSSTPWAVPWPCVHEFYSTVTRPNLFQPPSPAEVALDQLEAWADSPSLRFIAESVGHLRLLREAVRHGAVVGPRVHDARIVAICLSHGVTELITMDRDFSRFPQLRTRSILAD